ncbi:hypothetical protein IAQ61_009532 [Plenodomus lingam]|uniref:uncharacterized protein n=1 Tax=Leptosphaeria maculans TaxID=5022 RepID=UPI00331F953E|nr:hypothetical protein IAQ61_009532 [Plenodomus lingam]
MSSFKVSLKKDPQLAIPNRSSSLPRDRGTDRSRSLSRVTSAIGSASRLLPQRRGSHSTPRPKSLPIDDRSLEAPLNHCNLSNNASLNPIDVINSSGVQLKTRSASCSAAVRRPMHYARVQRWAGLTRTVSDWDFLRRDPELYYANGDCYVHLHARGASQRGPSFCIPFRVLKQKKCHAILDQCDAHITSSTNIDPRPLVTMPSSLNNPGEERSTIQLFIPAPNETSREHSFQWHITTRNFFALLLGKPLVGEHMGQAFVDLQDRLFLFRPDQTNNHQEFLDYLGNQGYRDLVECTDYALASLYYAEHYKLKAVWIDAFAHCVGMNESLVLSPEYTANSSLTKALLRRAHHEVDLRLNRISAALASFLQNDLSPAYLGITDSAHSHLDYFRQFLHGFYANKFGYWPPPGGVSFPKALYKSMFYDFQSLYDYLVDTESTSDISMQKPASGGLCILQTVSSFDKRHGFKAQPHPLPLLPAERSTSSKAEAQKALRKFKLANQYNKTCQLHSASAALAVATNDLDHVAANSKIVQAYMQFERVYAAISSQKQEKISAIDARKVRWLLIYGTLQYLTSALRAPREVRDYETPEYPLCCVAEQSSWNTDTVTSTPMATPLATPSITVKELSSDNRHSPLTIEPDCNREDYFSSPNSTAAPSRQTSFRLFDPRSLSMRNSRRNLKSNQHCASIVHENSTGLDPAALDCHRPVSSVYSQQSSASVLPDGAGPDTSWLRSKTPSARHSKTLSQSDSVDLTRPRTPLLDSTQLEHTSLSRIFMDMSDAPSRADSTGSTASSIWSEQASVASSKSSAEEELASPAKPGPGVNGELLGGFASVAHAPAEGFRTKSMTVATKANIPQSHIHPLLRQPSRPSGFEFNFETQQPLLASSTIEQSSHGSGIGIALSVPPPSPPPTRALPDLHVQLINSHTTKAMSPTTGERPQLTLRTVSADTVTQYCDPASKKPRSSSDMLSAIASPTSEMWEQYKAALTRPDCRSNNSSASTDAMPPPVSLSKMTQSFKVRSFRFPSSRIHASSLEAAAQKKENRLSSFWRR